jgi:hypothetical protein
MIRPVEIRESTVPKTRHEPVQVDAHGVVGPQYSYILSKGDFVTLTKVWSRLIFFGDFALALLITQVVTISAQSFSSRRLVVEPWQTWALIILAVVTGLLYALGTWVFNPKKKIVEKIEQSFEAYEKKTEQSFDE